MRALNGPIVYPLPCPPRKQGIDLLRRHALKILRARVLHHVVGTTGANALVDVLASDPTAAIDRQNVDHASKLDAAHAFVLMFGHF
jgi:hypothetical protein